MFFRSAVAVLKVLIFEQGTHIFILQWIQQITQRLLAVGGGEEPWARKVPTWRPSLAFIHFFQFIHSCGQHLFTSL